MEKEREFQKTSTSASLTTLKPMTVWITTNCGKFLNRWEYWTTLTCLLRKLYAGQEATVETGHWTTDWFQTGKGIWQGFILSPCLFNLYVEYIMGNAGLDELQAAIKIAWRNINNLRHADDTTVMAQNEEELKSLLMKVKEESEKAGLKLNSKKKRWPVKIWCMKQSTQSWCSGTTQRNGVGRIVGGGFRMVGHMCICGWFTLMYGRNHHNYNIAMQLASN